MRHIPMFPPPRAIIYSGLILICISGYYIFLNRYAVNVPYYDDFDNLLHFVMSLQENKSTDQLLFELFHQHNEHRLMFNRIVAGIYYGLFGEMNFKHIIVIAHFSILFLFFIVIRHYRDDEKFYPLALLTALLIFVPVSKASEFWAMAILSNTYVLLFAMLSFHFLAKPAWSGFAAGIGFAALSLYTQSGGLFVLFVGGMWLALQAVLAWSRTAGLRALIWWSVSALLIAGYFLDFAHPPHYSSLTSSLSQPFYLARFYITLLGSSLAYGNPIAGFAAGLLMSAAVLYLTLQRFFLKKTVLYAYMIFLLVIMAGITLARASLYDVEYILTSAPRYWVLSLHLAIIILVCLLMTLRRQVFHYVFAAAVLLAAIYVSSVYILSKPAVEAHRDKLLTAMAAFYQSDNQMYLEPIYLTQRLTEVAQLLRHAFANHYYTPPQKTVAFPTIAKKPLRKISPIPITENRRELEKIVISKLNGVLDTMSQHENQLHLTGWMNLPDDEDGIVYVTVPIAPESAEYLQTRRPDVAAALNAPELQYSGFTLVLTYPPETDISTLMPQVCVAYQGETGPLTLLSQLPAYCERFMID